MMGFASSTHPTTTMTACSVPLALHPLAQQLAVAAHRLGLLARAPLGGFFVSAAQLHFAEHSLALHLLFEDPEGLVDIVVANEDLHGCVSPRIGEPPGPHRRGR